MVTNWQDCSDLQSFAAAVARGDEIERQYHGEWEPASREYWSSDNIYRCRPKKPASRKIVMREYLYKSLGGPKYDWTDDIAMSRSPSFVRWTGGERPEEVPE